MALPSLTSLTINGHADPNDSDSDIDRAQLDRDLRLIDRLEKQKDALILHNDYERRKQNRRAKEKRERDPESLIYQRAFDSGFVGRIRAIDHEVRQRMRFKPLHLQEETMHKERRKLTPAHESELLDAYEDMDEFDTLMSSMQSRYTKKRVNQAVGRLLQYEMPDEIKLLILQSFQRMQPDDWKGMCNFIQKLCNITRNMCETLWPLIASEVLHIPVPKPDAMLWRSWIRQWCVKLTAGSPWARTLNKELFERGREIVDDGVFDDSYEEGLWRLQHTPPTLYFWENEVGSNTFGVTRIPDFDRPLGITWHPQDPKWIVEALRHDGRFLEVAPDNVKNDRDLVRLACSSHVNAMAFASEDVRADGAFIRSFMRSQPDVLRHISLETDDRQLRRLREFIDAVREEFEANDDEEEEVWNLDDHQGDEDEANGFEVYKLNQNPLSGFIKIDVRSFNGFSKSTIVDTEGVYV